MLQRIGKYQVVGLLGEGGMGAVYRARDPVLDRDVAVKVLSPELARDPLLVKRFEEEARALARIQHPNIMRVYTVGEHEGKRYFAMEFVSGETLEDRVRERGSLSLREVVDLFGQLLPAVKAIHAAGIVHRDIKAANIMIDVKGRTVLMDFGLAKRHGRAALTTAGSILGTPEYMAPEQALGDAVDGRADIYALGVVLFEALTGRPPFEGGDAFSIIRKQVEDAPPAAREFRSDLPEAVDTVLKRCLAKKPEDRYPDVDALAAALGELPVPDEPTDSAVARAREETLAAPAASPPVAPPSPPRVGPHDRTLAAPLSPRPAPRVARAPEVRPSRIQPVAPPEAAPVGTPEPRRDPLSAVLQVFGVAAGLVGLALIVLWWLRWRAAPKPAPKPEGTPVRVVLTDGTEHRGRLIETVAIRVAGRDVLHGKLRLPDGRIANVRLEDPPGVRTIVALPEAPKEGTTP